MDPNRTNATTTTRRSYVGFTKPTTTLLDDALLRDTSRTIVTLIGLLMLTLFMSIACCSAIMWLRCKRNYDSSSFGMGSSSASSMSSGAPPSPPMSDLNSVEKRSAGNERAGVMKAKRDGAGAGGGGGGGVFSIRAPFDFFDKTNSKFESKEIRSNCIYLFILLRNKINK